MDRSGEGGDCPGMETFAGIVGVLILAAGRSTRMGRSKLVEPLCGKPVIAHAADAAVQSGLPSIIILGHEADRVRTALRGRPIDHMVAADHALGMGRSIAAGIAAVPEAWNAVIICLGDMPLIEPELLRALAARGAADAIVVPEHEGRRGNPVLWGRRFFEELAALQGDSGGKPLLSLHSESVRTLAWADDSIHLDIDTDDAMGEVREAMARKAR